MDSQARQRLERIGKDLDLERYPRVRNGGFVVPSSEFLPTQSLGQENGNGNARKARPAAGPRKRTTGWQRPTRRSRSSDSPPPVRIGGLAERYAAQLSAVSEAYTNVRSWEQHYGAWLACESGVLTGLTRHVRFVVAVPFTTDRVRAWGYWKGAVEPLRWIGPRHTNFPEGSICAFCPGDQHLPSADDLVGLLDIYTLWALRHLHLEVLGTWPGQHAGAFASERLFEFRGQEFCGCGSEQLRYKNCCLNDDRKGNRIPEAVDFALTFAERCPPEEVWSFVQGGQPPLVESLEPSETLRFA
jgi:hypothetical protein